METTLEQTSPTQTRELTVQAKSLSKTFGAFEAVKDITLEIEPGAIYGFIGPNGAGKTTTMRMLATLLEPSGGEAWICGYSINDQRHNNLTALRSCIGYMPDFIGIYDKMTCQEYLEFFAAAYFIEPKRRVGLINDLLELVDLSAKKDSYIEGLSRGMTQRLALARTLIHDPRLLLLDEPASGLDPRARVELRELVKELSRMGKTIIISSHILTELTEMCSHVGIIERGTLLASGKVSEILGRLNQHLRVVKLRIRPIKTDKIEVLQNILLTGPGVKAVRPLPSQPQTDWEVQVEGNETELNNLLRYFVEKNVPLFGFAEQPTNLEEIFLQVTKGYVS